MRCQIFLTILLGINLCYGQEKIVLLKNSEILYNDLPQKPQKLSLTFNNSKLIKSIELLKGSSIEIRGYNSDSFFFDKNSPDLKIDSSLNTVDLTIQVINSELSKFVQKLKITDTSGLSVTYSIPLTIVNEYNEDVVFSLKPDIVYIDDFSGSEYSRGIYMDINKEKLDNKNNGYHLYCKDSLLLDITFVNYSKEKILLKPIEELRILSINEPKDYKIDIISKKSGTKIKYSGVLKVLPQPYITDVNILGVNGLEIEKGDKRKYALKIFGPCLHQMDDLCIELVNTSTGNAVPLRIDKSNYKEKDCINGVIDFNSESYATGKYYFRIKRPIAYPNKSIWRIYDLREKEISIVFPFEIKKDQLDYVDLVKPDLFAMTKHNRIERFINKKNLLIIEKENPQACIATIKEPDVRYLKMKQLNKDSLVIKIDTSQNSTRKKYNELWNNAITKNYLLNVNSDVKIRIDPYNLSDSDKFRIPQYLKLSASLYKIDGSIENKTITSDVNSYITVYDRSLFIDLKKLFNIEKLNSNERIVLDVSHAIEKYGYNYESPSRQYIYQRGSNFLERIGFTATIPPYLVVAKHTNIKDSAGNLTEDKKWLGQSLLLNAGIGVKYRWYNKYYDPSRFAISIYALGSDLGGSTSDEEKEKDVLNNDFIKKGSVNLAGFLEFSIVNLDNPLVKVPVYLGGMYIFDPIDKGSKLAFVLGLGIDIKLTQFK